MNLLDKLDYLMARDGLNKRTLSQKSGVPYMTISDLYKKGYANTKLSTIRKIASCFSVSLDYLIDDRITNELYGSSRIYSDDLMNSKKDERLQKICDGYYKLNDEGRDKLVSYSEDLVSTGRYIKTDISELLEDNA